MYISNRLSTLTMYTVAVHSQRIHMSRGILLLATEMCILCLFYFFFFQAEDGIRDLTVTGVQTCALPISLAEVAIRRWTTILLSTRSGRDCARSGSGAASPSPSSPRRPAYR